MKVELKKALDTIVNFESKENILNEKIKTLENSLTKNKKKIEEQIKNIFDSSTKINELDKWFG